MAAVACSSSLSHSKFPSPTFPNSRSKLSFLKLQNYRFRAFRPIQVNQVNAASSNVCNQEEILALDAKSLTVNEYFTEDELLAAVKLRIRTFYEFDDSSFNVEDHKKQLTEREYEGLKDRVCGMRIEFKRVTCINATVPLSASVMSAHELCSSCKFSADGEDRVVVGTLDLNQCLSLADELAGKRPMGTGSSLKRAYLSNVCVAKELQRNGLGYALITKAKEIGRDWGITDLYVHVAVDNKAAKKLYEKCEFVFENEEPAWQARFLNRPRRYLLWANLAQPNL